MPHPTPENFTQAVVMIMGEYVEESQHCSGMGAPYDHFDEVDGLVKMTRDFSVYLEHRDWNDERDNSYLTERRTRDVLNHVMRGH